MAVHVVTDSTSDLTEEILNAYGVAGAVHIVPLTVHFGDQEYRDGVDLDTATFYEKLRSETEMPRTSQPSPAAFIDLYRSISQPGDTILSYHLSSRLSGTHQSAMLAARQFEDRTIEVIDTRSASMGLGLIVVEAARDALAGKEPEAIAARSRERIAGMRLFFVVDTLEYLQRNGRIGKAQALLGGLLSVKPILTLEDGVVTPVEKARGKARALERLLTLIEESAGDRRVAMGGVLHAAAADEATRIAERLSKKWEGAAFHAAELGPTVGTHAGPGTLGVVLFVE